MDGVGGVLPDTDNGDDILVIGFISCCIMQQGVVDAFFQGLYFLSCQQLTAGEGINQFFFCIEQCEEARLICFPVDGIFFIDVDADCSQIPICRLGDAFPFIYRQWVCFQFYLAGVHKGVHFYCAPFISYVLKL